MKNRIKLDDIDAQIDRINTKLGREVYCYRKFGQSYSLDSNANASRLFESVAVFSSKRALYDALTISLAIIDPAPTSGIRG